MDFFGKMSDAIQSKGKEAADKARDLAEIASLRGQVGSCEEVIKKNYLEIGRLYYAKNKEEDECEFKEQCLAIKNAGNGIRALEDKIKEIKGV